MPDGAIDLRLHAIDMVGNEATQTIHVTKRVNCSPNDPPTQPRFAGLGNGARVSGVASLEIVASDSYDTPDELSVDYRVDDGSFAPAKLDSGTGRFEANWESSQVSDGAHTLRARVTDSAGLVAVSEPLRIVVDNVLEAPIANAGADQTLTDSDGNGSATVTLDGSQSTYDPNEAFTYAWEERTGHSATPLGSGPRIAVEFAEGAHTLTLVLTDDQGIRDEDVVVVQVNPRPDSTPRVELSPGSGRRGQPVTVKVTGYDPDEGISVVWDPGKTDAHGKGGKKSGGRRRRGKARRVITGRSRTVRNPRNPSPWAT